MRLVLETSSLIPFLQRNKRTISLFTLYAFLTFVIFGSAYIFQTYKPIFRDFAIANIAHVKAGPKIPFLDNEEEGYTRGFLVDSNSIYTYGIETNNVWAAEYARKIIPYMLYESVTPEPIYPYGIGVIPYGGNTSFHVAGQMSPSKNLITLNERYWIDERWSDQRRALGTLVHELVHVQRGAFITGESAELESATSTATVEVLAAMCNYGDTLACKAFWHDIENLARTSMLIQLNDLGLMKIYDFWANIFWRDAAEIDAYNKSMRYWSGNMDNLMTLRKKYNLVPWQNVIAGVTHSQPLNTLHRVCDSTFYGGETCVVNGMYFEDTWYLLQGLMWILNE